MARITKAHIWADNPELLTAIRTPWEHYRKVDWNFSRFEDAVFARPCDFETVMYTAIDFAVAVVSLRDWTRKWTFRDKRRQSKGLPDGLQNSDGFSNWIYQHVRWQPAIEAIANTAKHGEYRDGGWLLGLAMPATFVPDNLKAEHEACVDGVELFKFMHKHRDVVWWDVALRQHPEEQAEPGYVAFGDALDQWKAVLAALNLEND